MSLPTHRDVVVIGAGFAGASTAYHLSARGVTDVLVVEREATAGYHASGRNAALCIELGEDDELTALCVAGAKFLRNPPEELHRGCLVQPTGSLFLSDNPATLGAMSDLASRHRIVHETVNLTWVLTHMPRLSGVPAAGGIWFPNDGVIDIHGFLQGLLGAARNRGVEVALSCEVEKLRPLEGGGVEITTSQGVVTARVVVNAAGAWVGQLGALAGSADTHYQPQLRHLHLSERTPSRHTPKTPVWFVGAEEFYFRAEGEQLLMCTCDKIPVEPCDARAMPHAAEELAEKFKRYVPWLANLSLERTWACLRTFSPDGRPVIGWDRQLPWMFWVAGLGAHGATMAGVVGEIAASSIAAYLPA